MPTNRRTFLHLSGLASAGLLHTPSIMKTSLLETLPPPPDPADEGLSIIGQYGPWAMQRQANTLPSLSFRNARFSNLKSWKKLAKTQTLSRMGYQAIPGTPEVKVIEQFNYDGLHIEKLSWQLPYGRPTEAILLKPANASGKLPGILALHDHGGNKYFGTHKITKTADTQHPMMLEHQQEYYGGKAWANEIAKQGYVVLVPDSFTFASRRVMLQDVPSALRRNLNDDVPEKQENIDAYNQWASNHEHIMAKSLFSAGTSWPAVFFAEDQKALDVLCARPEVEASKVGCAGLSGGGLRTVYLAGLDERIQCAIPVGFMTTWADFCLHKSYTHTWMTYVPMLPNELDFPEILGLRTPLPTLVLNDSEDTLYTLPEMQRADEMLHAVYSKAKAAERYHCSFYPGPHKFDVAMQQEAFAWFERWLR